MKHIFIHGLGQTPASWDKTINALGIEDCVCPDLPALVRDSDKTFQSLYLAFAAYCNDFNDEVALCGLSLGAVLALNYAIDDPEKVKSLILIAPQYKMPKGMLRFQNIIFRFMPKSMFTEIGFEKNDYIALCRSMMNLDFSGPLHKIECRTLVLHGEKDSANKKAAAEIAAKIKNADLQFVAGSGHEVNVDAPEKLAEIIQTFINKTAE